MAYLLNSVDLNTYGIRPGRIPGSNICISGCFDMPARIGKTYHSWGDEEGVEPYVDANEIFFGGRDIKFIGIIQGTRDEINSYVAALYAAVNAFTDLVVFSTPYGDFSVQVKNIVPEYSIGICEITIMFYEPVVDLIGATLPETTGDPYTIDGIAFYPYRDKSTTYNRMNLEDLKEQNFTKYGAEGYQMSKRKSMTLELSGPMIDDTIEDFISEIKLLYLLFSMEGTRTIILNNEIEIVCFAVDGFKIDDIFISNTVMTGKFKMNLVCQSVNFMDALMTEGSEVLTTEDSLTIYA